MAVTRYADYRRAALATLTRYRRQHFAGREALFERGPGGERLFRSEVGHLSFFDPALYHALTRRPRAFRQLANPQVLAISVLGTLDRRDGLGLLARVPCDDGRPVMADEGAAEALTLEVQRRVRLPGGRQVVVDVWFRGEDTARQEPRPDGNAAGQMPALPAGRLEAGAPMGGDLVMVGRFLERTLGPLGSTLRAVEAVGSPACVLLAYDARNPAYQPGRQADRQFLTLGAGLPSTLTLRRTTWQALAAAMAEEDWYSDLLEYLREKYGIEPG